MVDLPGVATAHGGVVQWRVWCTPVYGVCTPWVRCGGGCCGVYLYTGVVCVLHTCVWCREAFWWLLYRRFVGAEAIPDLVPSVLLLSSWSREVRPGVCRH